MDRVYGLGRADLAVVAVADVGGGGGGHWGVELGGEGAVVVVAVVVDVGDAEVVFACVDGVSIKTEGMGDSLFLGGVEEGRGKWGMGWDGWRRTDLGCASVDADRDAESGGCVGAFEADIDGVGALAFGEGGGGRGARQGEGEGES